MRAQAGQYGALPLENRGALEIITTDRPQLSKPRNRYVYYPGTAEVPESVAPNIRNRSCTIAVEVTIDTGDAAGVLFAHGARFCGHALYVKDGRLAGRGRIRTQPGKFSIAGEGLNVGKDSGEPVTGDYPGQAPWAFTGGTIHRAAVDVSGEPFTDLAAEVRMAFLRD